MLLRPNNNKNLSLKEALEVAVDFSLLTKMMRMRETPLLHQIKAVCSILLLLNQREESQECQHFCKKMTMMRMTLFLKLRLQQKACLHCLLQVEAAIVSFHHLCHKSQQTSPHQCCPLLYQNLLLNQFLLLKNKQHFGMKKTKMMMTVQVS